MNSERPVHCGCSPLSPPSQVVFPSHHRRAEPALKLTLSVKLHIVGGIDGPALSREVLFLAHFEPPARCLCLCAVLLLLSSAS